MRVNHVPEHLREFIEPLQLALHEVADCLNAVLDVSIKGRSNREERQILGEVFNDEINKFSDMAEISGLVGLRQSCAHVLDNVVALKIQKYKLSEEQVVVWQQWHNTVEEYLNAPMDQDVIQTLVVVHCSPDWLSVLSNTKTTELLINLKGLALSEGEVDKPILG